MRTRHLAAAGACLAVAGGLSITLAQGVFASLGMPEAAAQRDIVYAFISGNVNVYPAAKAVKAAPPAARATLVKGVFDWARTYTSSAAYKAQYDRERANAAPKPQKPKTVDGELARQKAEQQKSIDEAKKNLAQMPANVRAQVEATIKQMEAENAKREADPKFTAMMRQMTEAQIADEQKRYDESVVRYNQKYPADPNVLIAARLRQFLEVSKDVDFGAALVPGPGNKQRFANAAYEAKPDEWKLCYRAGKEATAAGREAAQAWLAALGK
jgi:hypothetical protein